MYAVTHADDRGDWLLYRVVGGEHEVVGWFVKEEDALFAKECFDIQWKGEDGAPGHGGPALAD